MRGLSAEKNQQLAEKISSRLGQLVGQLQEIRGMLVLVCEKENLLPLVKVLREDASFAFDLLMDLTAVDYLGQREKRFEMVYMLYSTRSRDRLRIKVAVAEGESVPSLVKVWKAANWPEREVFDLMGISFDDHPQMERLIMPDGYIGHPLRKDFPLRGRGEDYLIESILRSSGSTEK